MPVMDGYTLTKNIKDHPILSELTVMLHSSLSGAFNTSMVQKVGADDFIAKYDATELAGRVLRHLKLKSPANSDTEQAA
jgi:two-component system, chemotaxis family, chemotaxis protein CheV